MARISKKKVPGEALDVPQSLPTDADNQVRNNRTVSKLNQLSTDLNAIATTIDTYEHAVALFLEVGVQKADLLACYWAVAPPEQDLAIFDKRVAHEGVNSQTAEEEFLAIAKTAIEQGSETVSSPTSIRGVDLIAVPIKLDSQRMGVIGGMVHQAKESTLNAGVICQLMAASFEIWRSRNMLTALNSEVLNTAVVLDLVGKISATETRRDACLVIANELKNHFACDQVAVGLKTPATTGCELFAISSMSDFDNQSRTTICLKNAFDETVMRGGFTAFPSGKNTQTGPTLAHKKLQAHTRVPVVVSIPLRNDADEIVGAVTLLGRHELERQPEIENLIRAMEHPLGASIDLVRAAEGGPLRRVLRKINKSKQKNMPRIIVGAIVASLLAMLIPMPYGIHCKCVAEPVVRSFSVAPYEGLLETTFAEPGMIVKKGDLLARMDGRAITYEIAGVTADRQRAARTHDQLLANQKVSDAIRSGLERDALQNKLDLLEFKRQNLKIVSPVDGIVLAGSIDKRENYPVELGETLYEIAPLETLKVELSIPSNEVMHVAEGQSVRLRFDGFGTKRHAAAVRRVRPSSTIRDDQNVFVAEVEMQNDDFQIRPGMAGNAKVYGRWKTLGWSLFHLPWEKFVTAIGF